MLSNFPCNVFNGVSVRSRWLTAHICATFSPVYQTSHEILVAPSSLTRMLLRQVFPVLVTSILYSIVSPAFKTPSSPASVSVAVTKEYLQNRQVHIIAKKEHTGYQVEQKFTVTTNMS